MTRQTQSLILEVVTLAGRVRELEFRRVVIGRGTSQMGVEAVA